MLNVYSRARDGETLLSRSFRAKEFACKDGTDPLFVDSELVQVLQAIRDHFGAPVVITSGYRTPAHNAKAGGTRFSQHLYGRAADIRVRFGDDFVVEPCGNDDRFRVFDVIRDGLYTEK